VTAIRDKTRRPLFASYLDESPSEERASVPFLTWPMKVQPCAEGAPCPVTRIAGVGVVRALGGRRGECADRRLAERVQAVGAREGDRPDSILDVDLDLRSAFPSPGALALTGHSCASPLERRGVRRRAPLGKHVDEEQLAKSAPRASGNDPLVGADDWAVSRDDRVVGVGGRVVSGDGRVVTVDERVVSVDGRGGQRGRRGRT
jgi:hypothetical protein